LIYVSGFQPFLCRDPLAMPYNQSTSQQKFELCKCNIAVKIIYLRPFQKWLGLRKITSLPATPPKMVNKHKISTRGPSKNGSWTFWELWPSGWKPLF